MPHYRIECSAFKRSGKFYNSGNSIDLGVHPQYPVELVEKARAEIYEDLDKACSLVPNAVKTNDYVVLIQVLDDTPNPIAMQYLVL